VITATSGQIGSLLVRVQAAFLDNPALTLSARDAQRLFDANVVMCEAVLGVLVDAGVLVTGGGIYIRPMHRLHTGPSIGSNKDAA
jgi:hypothetical protein